MIAARLARIASPWLTELRKVLLAVTAVTANKTLRSSVSHGLAILASLAAIIPVYLVCVNSLKSEAQSSSMGVELPTELHFENFTTVINEGRLVTSFLNSMLYAGGGAVLATLFAALAAFVLSRHRTRINRALYFFLIMGIALPINFFTLTKILQ